MVSIKELEASTYTEYINIQNGLKILQNWNNIKSKLPKTRQNKIDRSEYDPVISLKKICKDKKNIIYTSYKFSKSLKTYGRLFAQNASLQGLPREMRNALAFGLYYDIDMSNAHPTFLSQYCEMNNINCKYLDNYIQNRENILKTIYEKDGEEVMSRDDAKQLILTIMNGGECYLDNPFITNFKKEIKQIHKQVCLLNQDEFKKVKTRKEYNPEGTMMNILLCKLEHNVLMNSVSFMKSQGFNVDVLVFDGFMVRKEDDKPITEETLSKLQEYINSKTGYNIKFVEKSLKNIIDLSVYPDPLLDDNPPVSYYKDKEEFEKTHLKITHPALYISLLDDGTIDLQTEEKITASYKHLKTTILDPKGVPIKIPFIKYWINDENIRIYDRMVFVPPPAEYNNFKEYNTWIDFEQESKKLPEKFDIDTNQYILKYKEFVNNLFDGNVEFINYYHAWCANIIQNPAKRSCVCLVLYSLFEGVGKNMVIKTLEKCVGENYTYYLTDVGNQLFGKHSCAEMNRLLLVLNEVKGKDTYANTDLFKTRITDIKREVEMKGKEAFQIKNYCSYILNSNNPNVVNASDKDRRFCVLSCVNKKIDDKLYFDDYERIINDNPEAIRCIYQFLKSFDIEKVVPNKIFASARPRSELYQELQECNKEKEWDFLENIVIENKDKDEVRLSMEVLWTNYKSYCNTNNYDISKLPSKRFHYNFSQQIIQYLNNKEDFINSIIKDRTSTKRIYKFDICKLKKFFKIEDNGFISDDDE